MFLARSYELEMMDNFSIDDERIDSALDELKIINKFLGGIATTESAVNNIRQKKYLEGGLSVLDVGSGAADILTALKNKFKNLEVTSIDVNKRAALYLKDHTIIKNIVCGDIKSNPFKDHKFDLVHASLFFHHFKEEEIRDILSDLFQLCRYAIIVNDLRRSILALLGIKLLTLIFSKSEMVKNDAPLSVKRGFTKSELENILRELNYKYTITRKWAFRWCLIIYKH